MLKFCICVCAKRNLWGLTGHAICLDITVNLLPSVCHLTTEGPSDALEM